MSDGGELTNPCGAGPRYVVAVSALTPLRRTLRNSILMLAAVIVIGMLGYRVIEGWGWIEGLWMVVVTFTTIGYDVPQPLSVGGRLFTILLILAGLGAATFSMTTLTQAMFDGELMRLLRERARRKKMAALTGHYIVIGYGRLGSAVVQELREASQEVCVVERDPALVERAGQDGLVAMEGDGGDDALLDQVGLARARGVAITVPDPADAIYITMSVRQLNPTIAIQTRVASPAEAVKAVRAGATAVVSPHVIGGWKMAHGLLRPHTTSFMDLAMLASHPSVRVDEVTVPVRSSWVGQPLRRLNLGRGVLIVAIRRKDGTVLAAPGADDRIEPEDVLILIGDPQRLTRVEDLTGLAPG